MRTRRGLFSGLVGSGLVVLLCAGLSRAQNYSHVRIVRLSFVEGTVTVQRPDMPEWSTAPVNTPLQEGFKVSAAENSFAEVQFENTSTARLGQLSLLEFNQLALAPSGAKLNRLTLHHGYATFNFIPERDDVNEVKTGDTTLTPASGAKAMFRIDIDEGVTRVEVFKGSLDVSSPSGSETLTGDMVVELRPGAEQPFSVSRGITKDAWDEWVDQRESQSALAPSKQAPGYYPSNVPSNLYGWNDLSYFGNWSYFPGFGYGWLPFVSYGWSPFSFGRWLWDPVFGNTWLPYEPWGWVPFHYGGWSFIPSAGWCWFPGSFGNWSPAPVTWYQGPGWIGWAPQPSQGGAVSGTGQNKCSQAPGCVTAVSLNNFENGMPVTPNTALAIDLSKGRPIVAPGIPPTRLRMLPGIPVSPAEIVRAAQGTGGANLAAKAAQPGIVRAPTSSPLGFGLVDRDGLATQPGIVYDPQSRGYVNSLGTQTSLGPKAPLESSPASVADYHGGTEAASKGSTSTSPSRVKSAPSARSAPSSSSQRNSAPSTSSARSAPSSPSFGSGGFSGSHSSVGGGGFSGAGGGAHGGGGRH